MKTLILCADDYALAPHIDVGIRALVVANRLSAVSCMTNSPHWPEASSRLKEVGDDVQVGVHLNFTDMFSGSKTPLLQLISGCMLGFLDEQYFFTEINRQLDLFEVHWGSRPDFIDGHQHVHVFPKIRHIVISVLVERYSHGNRPWLRRVNPKLIGHDAFFKALVLRVLSIGFDNAAERREVSLSGDFYGIYSLSSKADFSLFFTRWIYNASNHSLIMCHPGGVNEASSSSLSDNFRIKECDYFLGDEFLNLCESGKVNFVIKSYLDKVD